MTVIWLTAARSSCGFGIFADYRDDLRRFRTTSS
jgi:hypothetical protein